MTDQNSNSTNQQRRLDPELLKKGLRCDLDQYEMLKRCSDKKDMTEWNQWREMNKQDIFLEGANFNKSYFNSVLLDEDSIHYRGKVYLKGRQIQECRACRSKVLACAFGECRFLLREYAGRVFDVCSFRRCEVLPFLFKRGTIIVLCCRWRYYVPLL